jgi:putative oxidoreductase
VRKVKEHGPVVARTLLGLIYLMGGIVGLLQLVPPPADLPQAMMDFQNSLENTQYFFPLLKITETICGFLLVIAIAPALALIVLAPITINIFFVHFYLTPGIENLILPVLLIILQIVAASQYWHVYRPLFQRKP